MTIISSDEMVDRVRLTTQNGCVQGNVSVLEWMECVF
jgi:hypothetical protein